MNNVGVFGDSFAHRHKPHSRQEEEHQLKGKKSIRNWEEKERVMDVEYKREFPTFMEYIRDDNNSVKTHALPGTDLLWSFVQFEKYHELYDTIIFVLTSSDRISINYDWDTKKLGDFNKPLTTTNIASCQQQKAAFAKDYSAQGVELYHIFSGLEKWYELCATDGFLEREWIIYNLIIERIKQIRPDVKLIKAFPYIPDLWAPLGNRNVSTVRDGVGLIDIMHIEDNAMSYIPLADTSRLLDGSGQVPKGDARQCHLTAESHKILAGQIKKWLKTDELYLNINLKEFEGINPDVKKYFVSEHASFTDWMKYNNINTGIDDGK